RRRRRRPPPRDLAPHRSQKPPPRRPSRRQRAVVPEAPPRVRLGDVRQVIGGDLVGSEEFVLAGVCSLEEAGPRDLAYVTADRHIPAALKSRAAAFLTHRALRELERPHVVVPNPAHAMVTVIGRFFTPAFKPRGISESIAPGADARIGPRA